MTVPVPGVNHGTYAAYKGRPDDGIPGCRCDRCRTYQNNRVMRNRKDRLTSGRLTHGNRSSADTGCRCPLCEPIRRIQSVESRKETMRNKLLTAPVGPCPACGVRVEMREPGVPYLHARDNYGTTRDNPCTGKA